MLVSVVHTKGGVGKSTSVLYLAAAAHRAGLGVEVFDTDPQGSARRWWHAASAAHTPLPFPVSYASAQQLSAHEGADLVLVDTPPGDTTIIDAAIDAADLVIVPTQPSPADLDRVWPTLRITAHRPTAVLFTRAKLGTLLIADARAVLEEHDVAVLKTPILDREHVKQAWASPPADLNGYDDVLQEILAATTPQHHRKN